LNLKKLEVFYYTAKYRSYSIAADKLQVTQPAVSMQIRELERFYDVTLFLWSGNQLQLTNSGKILYWYARKIFNIATEAEKHLLDLRKVKAEILRIGVIRSYAKYILPRLISEFQKNNPQVKIVVEEGMSAAMAQSVVKMENDLALVANGNYGKGLRSVPFSKEEIFLAVSKRHKWFERTDKIGMEELRKEKIIIREQGSTIRSIILKLFEKHHIDPHNFLEADSYSFIKEMVKYGNAVSLFSATSIREEIEKGILRPLRLSSGEIYIDIRIFFRAKESLSPPAKKFLKILEENASPV
jgi:DNA-binding transcriptional LysR family regulator